jgi:flagellar hook protein FlgE
MVGAIFTSLSGMNAYTKGLDVISNNVSNMNTPGFKLSEPLFRDLVYQFGGTLGNGQSSSDPTGAGVQARQSSLSMQQGQLRATGNNLDAALSGSGFFVVDQNGQRQYTRAGQFEFNKDGILVETGTGAKVLMSTDASASTYFDLNTVRIFPPKATAEVTLSGALMRATTGTAATTYSLSPIQVFDTTGTALQLTAKLTPTIDSPARATTEVKLSGTLTRATADSGATIYSMPPVQVFDSNGTPLPVKVRLTPDVADALHWSIDILDDNDAVLGSGDLRFNDDGTPASGSSSVSVSVTPGTGPAFNVNFNFGDPGTNTGVTSVTGTTDSALQVRSQDGAAAVQADPLHWAVDILDANNVVQGHGDIRFNADGTPATGASTVMVTVTPASGPTFSVSFNFGAPGTYAGVTSVTGTTASQLQVLKQNGAALGTITATEFDVHGNIKITYSNGETKTPAKLVLAQFDQPDQLKEVDGSHFVTANSQLPTLGSALTSGIGSVVGGQIEMSNVDLTSQFTDLIIVQRGFQACSQITNVANEMMQQLLGMNGGK